jgi:hypothetical protein
MAAYPGPNMQELEEVCTSLLCGAGGPYGLGLAKMSEPHQPLL